MHVEQAKESEWAHAKQTAAQFTLITPKNNSTLEKDESLKPPQHNVCVLLLPELSRMKAIRPVRAQGHWQLQMRSCSVSACKVSCFYQWGYFAPCIAQGRVVPIKNLKYFFYQEGHCLRLIANDKCEA